MKNPGQHNSEFRQYESVIAESKAKTHQQPSKMAVKDGVARRKVEALMEQQKLARELDLWTTT